MGPHPRNVAPRESRGAGRSRGRGMRSVAGWVSVVGRARGSGGLETLRWRVATPRTAPLRTSRRCRPSTTNGRSRRSLAGLPTSGGSNSRPAPLLPTYFRNPEATPDQAPLLPPYFRNPEASTDQAPPLPTYFRNPEASPDQARLLPPCFRSPPSRGAAAPRPLLPCLPRVRPRRSPFRRQPPPRRRATRQAEAPPPSSPSFHACLASGRGALRSGAGPRRAPGEARTSRLPDAPEETPSGREAVASHGPALPPGYEPPRPPSFASAAGVQSHGTSSRVAVRTVAPARIAAVAARSSSRVGPASGSWGPAIQAPLGP